MSLRIFCFHLVLCFFWREKVNAQYIYQTIDTDTKKAVPYVTVKVKNKNNGFYTDENGYFKFTPSTNDTLIFTAVGFSYREITLTSITDKIILLKPVIISLKEVKIRPDKTTTIGTYNAKSDLRMGASIKFEYAVRQILPENVSEAKLDKVFIKVANMNTECPIKLHIYSSKNNEPFEELLHTNILVNEYPIKKKRIEIDLSEMNILINSFDFFVGIEWIDDTEKSTNKTNYLFATYQNSQPLTYGRTIIDPNYKWRLYDNKSVESTVMSKNNNPINLQISTQISYGNPE